ncbi:c-type cytochrome [Rudaea cellulosilytica]|uniref:c-type cytochrome n=1 Tax=Rudaea cellulosilytica TaxID=540746 RepID=UPI0003AA4A1D|nr:cytochrome c [Rudaea cellulosilytica]
MGMTQRGRVLRVLLIVVAVLLVAGTAFAIYLRGPGPTDFAGGQKVALAEYKDTNPTSIPASKKSADPIQRGKYLAEAADCLVCHTTPDGQQYAGGFAFTLPFGTIYSTNITPDKETGIGNYTDQDFLAAVHRGVRKDGAWMYPAMPFTSYTYMTDEDALAIKAYLFSLTPVRAPARANTLTFPFNQRWAIGLWSAVFNPNKRFQPDSSKSAEWNRGAYLSEALAHCGECHTPRNIGFALNNRKKFGGGNAGGWLAYNISADKGSGIGNWSDDDVAAYIGHGHANNHGSASGPMGEAVSESLSRLEPEDLRAIVAYVRSVPATSSDLPAQLAPPAPRSHREGFAANARGKQVFEGACMSCHNWDGVADISPYATLTGSRAVNDPSGINVAQIVITGSASWSENGSLNMPAFGQTYSNEEIAEVANYVTARFGTQGSSLTERDVASLRRQSAQ